MCICDFYKEYVVTNPNEVDQILRINYGNGYNSFWIAMESNSYPCLAILTNNNLACVHYFPEERDSGFQSVSFENLNLNPSGETEFRVENINQSQFLNNDSVIELQQAIEVVREFMMSPLRPTAIP